MTSLPIRALWPHEGVRTRPGMYLPFDSDPPLVVVFTAVLDLVEQLAGDGAAALFSPPKLPKELCMPTLEVMSSEPVHEAADVDRRMTHLDAPPLPDRTPAGNLGCIVSSLCARVLVQTKRKSVGFEGRYARGGTLSPFRQTPLPGFTHGTRIVAMPDPILFDHKLDPFEMITMLRRARPRFVISETPADPF